MRLPANGQLTHKLHCASDSASCGAVDLDEASIKTANIRRSTFQALSIVLYVNYVDSDLEDHNIIGRIISRHRSKLFNKVS